MNKINENVIMVNIEIKLAINKTLYEKGLITEEMHIKAKEMILKT